MLDLEKSCFKSSTLGEILKSENGQVLHLRSESRSLKLDSFDCGWSAESILNFRISDLRCRTRPFSDFKILKHSATNARSCRRSSPAVAAARWKSPSRRLYTCRTT